MKTSNYYLLSILVGLIITLTQCSIHKRIYRKGYFVSWNKYTKLLQKPLSSKEKTTGIMKHVGSFKTIDNFAQTGPIIEKPLLISAITMIETNRPHVKKKRLLPSKNKVQSNFFMGSRLEFEVNRKKFALNPKDSTYQTLEKQYNSFAILSLIFSFISVIFIWLVIPVAFIATLLGGISGCIASAQYKMHKNKYKGKWMLVLGTSLCTLILFFLFIYMMANAFSSLAI